MPDHWQETTLGDALNECRNGLQYKNDPSAGGLPISRIQTISGGRINLKKVGFAGLSESEASRYMLEAGDILFSHINSAEHVGNCVLVEDLHLPLIHGMNLLRLKSSEICLSEFLLLVIADPRFRGMVRGHSQKAVSQVSINQTALRALAITLPPLDEQERIVDVVGSIDSYISALEDQLGATRAARAALLYDLLSHPGDDWQELRIEGLLDHTIGGVWGKPPGEDEVDVTVLRSTNFTAIGEPDLSDVASRSITSKQFLSRRLRSDDILLEKSGGGPKQPVGRVVFIREEMPTSVCANFVQLVRCDPNLVVPRFLFLKLWLDHVNGLTEEYQSATTGIRNLRTKDYLGQQMHLPSLREQRRIVDVVGSFDVQVEALVAQLGAARRLRSGVLSELLSGERLLDESYDVVVGL